MEDPNNLVEIEHLKDIIRVLLPVAWNADRGRQDEKLAMTYAMASIALGLTKEDIQKMANGTVQKSS